MSDGQKMIKMLITVAFMSTVTIFSSFADDDNLSSIKSSTESITTSLKTTQVYYEDNHDEKRVGNTPSIKSDLARIEKNNNSNMRAIKRIEDRVNPEKKKLARTYLKKTRGRTRSFRKFTKRTGRKSYGSRVGLRKKKKASSRSKTRNSYFSKLGRR